MNLQDIFSNLPILVTGYLSGLPGLPPPGGGGGGHPGGHPGHPGGPPMPAGAPPRQVHPGLPGYPPGKEDSLPCKLRLSMNFEWFGKKVYIELTKQVRIPVLFCNLHLSCCCSSRGHSSEIIKFLFLCSSTEVDEAQRLTILKSCLNTTEVVFVDLQKGTSSTLKWSSQQKFKYPLWKRFTC